jgi:hypothetical protein
MASQASLTDSKMDKTVSATLLNYQLTNNYRYGMLLY